MSVWERMFLDLTSNTDAAVQMCKFPIPQAQMQPGCQTCWCLTYWLHARQSLSLWVRRTWPPKKTKLSYLRSDYLKWSSCHFNIFMYSLLCMLQLLLAFVKNQINLYKACLTTKIVAWCFREIQGLTPTSNNGKKTHLWEETLSRNRLIWGNRPADGWWGKEGYK